MPRFVPSQLDPHRMIAAETLDTLRVLLRGSGSHRSPTGEQPLPHLTVSVPDHAILTRIGGVARVDPGPGGAVGIARVGRCSFVAFELGAEGLHELAVEVDESGTTLRIDRSGSAAPVPPGTSRGSRAR